MFKKVLLIVLGLWLASGSAISQTKPTGTPVLNQAVQAAAISAGSAFPPTRAVYIGDATACNASFYFVKSSTYVTLTNLQPGVGYPFQVVQISSTGTTCTAIFGLW